MFEIDNILCKTEVYTDETIIKTQYRIQKQQQYRQRQGENKQYMSNNYNFHHTQNSQQSGQFKPAIQYKPSEQYRRNVPKHNSFNTNRHNTQNQPRQNPSMRFNNQPIPMEIDNIFKPENDHFVNQNQQFNKNPFNTDHRIRNTIIECIENSHYPNNSISIKEEIDFKNSTICHTCSLSFTDPKNDKVRDHCYSTDQFRGAAHKNCNLNYRDNYIIPIVFPKVLRFI